MLLSIILVIVGFLFLIKGADFLVDGASAVAKKFGISEMIIGLTIVAMGTSMPELVVSIKSALEGHSDIALGNVIGSNMANVLLILGICALMKQINIPKATRHIENPLCLILTVLLFALCMNGGVSKIISQKEGIFLLLLFVCYLTYLFISARKNAKNDKSNNSSMFNSKGETVENVRATLDRSSEIEESKSNGKFIINVFKIIIGIVALKFGADFVVDNAVNIAQIIGISEKIIGVTIIAIGTSLPELVSSVTAIYKGENELAIGNIVGSNIFNILLILGISSSISPISYSLNYNFDMVYLIITGLLLAVFPYIGKGSRAIDRAEGLIFVTMYLAYILCLLFVI